MLQIVNDHESEDLSVMVLLVQLNNLAFVRGVPFGLAAELQLNIQQPAPASKSPHRLLSLHLVQLKDDKAARHFFEWESSRVGPGVLGVIGQNFIKHDVEIMAFALKTDSAILLPMELIYRGVSDRYALD